MAQRGQELETWSGRIRFPREQMGSQAASPVAFPEELANQLSGTIGLVLIHKRGGLVGVLGHSVLPSRNRGAGEIGWVVGTSRTHTADGNRAIAPFYEEVEAVVEILGEGHPEDVRLSAWGCGCFLNSQAVGDLTGVKALEDWVDLGGAKGRIHCAEARFCKPDELLIGSAKDRVGGVVLAARQIAYTKMQGCIITLYARGYTTYQAQ